ncbi:hypothetical protein D358_00007 [Enterococcus faecalis RP2S-4]|uniref:Uncharacterized protein n=1 Tax=Enterococcus faecalis RP2S-4 TaxID=1244145 RepID=A0ABC9TNU5_ENTFL|nr:hypothetical protein D358_00007 [Enterococcus faecalis RP2S-4]
MTIGKEIFLHFDRSFHHFHLDEGSIYYKGRLYYEKRKAMCLCKIFTNIEWGGIDRTGIF